MTRSKVSFTELAHQVVSESLLPLTVPEIMERVNAITPITTKNPKSTIRNAISQSRLIVPTGDGSYGWKPHLITGSVLCLTLSVADLTGKRIELTEELRDALWPSFFEAKKRQDRRPVQLELPNGAVTPFPLMHLVERQWGSEASPEFWDWFQTLGATAGDHLLFSVLDGPARRYRVDFQPFGDRDEAAIGERNQTIIQALGSFVRSRPRGAMSWDITSHLLATGFYRHPIPPDPLVEIWTEDSWGPNIVEGRHSMGYFWENDPQPEPTPDPQLRSTITRTHLICLVNMIRTEGSAGRGTHAKPDLVFDILPKRRQERQVFSVNLADAVANAVGLPFDRISLEILYRGLYYFTNAYGERLARLLFPSRKSRIWAWLNPCLD